MGVWFDTVVGHAGVKVGVQVHQAGGDKQAGRVDALHVPYRRGPVSGAGDAAAADADRPDHVDALRRVEQPAPDDIDIGGHASPSTCRCSSAAANAWTVSSTSRSPCALERNPEPWNKCTPSLSMAQFSAAASLAGGTLAFRVAASSGCRPSSWLKRRWNVELAPKARPATPRLRKT